MTQVGEGRGATAGGPVAGELLAERYQLEQHIDSDSAGRQIWYGLDVILRRPVTIVIRYPGGPAAAQMMQHAVEASRITHPNLAGVYDAIDEQSRAYVVREWVDGASLREHVAAGPFDAERATTVAHAVAAAVTALHASGMAHGNIHGGTVLIGRDGRVVLADGRADGVVGPEEDVRAVGAVLYYALTGYWPHAEVPGSQSLPDAPRADTGELASPRQVRAGVPDQLDHLAMELLDRRIGVPPAEVLAGEFARLDSTPDDAYYLDQAEPDTGPVRLVSADQAPPSAPSGRKLFFGVGALVAVAVLGLLVGLRILTGDGETATPPPQAGLPTADSEATPGHDEITPAPLPLTADNVRIVDPPDGSRTELDGVEALVDGDLGTSWRTDRYLNDPRFGLLKPGMGILVDLGEPRRVTTVIVETATGGAVADLRVGDADPGSTSEGDQQVYDTFTPISDTQTGSTMVFSSFEPDSEHRYLLVWFSELPPDGDGYRVEVQQVTVEGY